MQDWNAGQPLPFSLQRAHKLHDLLFGEVAEQIKGKELLIVASGALTRLPFQVLVADREEQSETVSREVFAAASWLGRQQAVTVLPSVSSLNALRALTPRSRARRPFIGFGNPLLVGQEGNNRSAWNKQSCVGRAPDSILQAYAKSMISGVTSLFRGGRANVDHIRSQEPLPETADELCEVARSVGVRHPNSSVFLGAKATEASIKNLSRNGSLAKYKILHFATHGLLAAETAMLAKGELQPALILTPPDKATELDDGLLTTSEVTALRLDADWVILSACNTAGGQRDDAEALSGLARAFFYAGARALLVSHWYVYSKATVDLIKRTIREMTSNVRLNRAQALRRAMRHMIESDSEAWHPSKWAPFVVVGQN
jgi:CHAT domain-containing protein